ncbi:DUF1223 domain-containing protein [uncultured Winogradskyella sp.]|uniref:DUF1223 domain-containing protein n=1 Tax=uncultured Winogradskyella sp. TaxID=395353 RepID=UPI0026304A22|nr:DUF1223 domain-containing protein [uncultured Winogradskyella sp.]
MKSTLFSLFVIQILIVSLLLYSKEKVEKLEKDENVVVLELFTSQGCSSCPPADEYLNQLKNDEIIALSYHVDYWNYIGWNDPFSKSTYTEKQRIYGLKFNSSTIYKPQLVINGKEHIVGSDKRLVNEKIAHYSKKKNINHIKLSEISKLDNLVKFHYHIDGDITDKHFRSILVINERKTSVKRGENKNRELINSNIVVNETYLELNNHLGQGSIQIPEIVEDNDHISLIVVVQDKALDITGADRQAL